jgi:undecaprenyl-phosphate 4-deoxy-4-formamido-L-arabinose transferase
MLVSLVIPCYNSEASIDEVVSLTMAEFAQMDGYDCEFVLVNDGSADGTYAAIRRLGEAHPNVRGIDLMRNFGQHNAIMCGMNYAQGDYVMCMDDDLQTHPSQIRKILGKMQEGYDLVFGVYRTSTNGVLKRMTSWFNTVSSRILLGRPKGIETSNFWCITRAVRNEIIRSKAFSPYTDGLLFRTTTRIGNVQIEHHRREHGASGYTLRKLMKLWLAYFTYSVVPLRIASFLGLASAFVGLIAGIVTVIRRLLDPTMLMGWASVVSLMLFLAGLILFVLGIIGEYVGDAVLMLNGTPQYIVREGINIDCEQREGSAQRVERDQRTERGSHPDVERRENSAPRADEE